MPSFQSMCDVLLTAGACPFEMSLGLDGGGGGKGGEEEEGKGKGKGKGEGKGEGEEEGEGEEDGVRVVWDSAPPPSVRKQRSAWANADLREKLTWTQTSSEVIASISLPPGTCAKDCRVQITPTRLAISLSW